MSDLLESRLDAERRAACLANDVALGVAQHRPMEELREAYVRLACVVITLMAVSFTAGFSLAHVLQPVPVRVAPVFPSIDIEV